MAPSRTDRQAPAARAEAFRILHGVETSEARASRLLRGMPAGMPPRERALATELVLGTLRWQRKLDHALGQFADRPVAAMDPPVRVGLRMAAHQILHLERIPRRAAVDESVTLVRAAAGRGAAGFANAVLRSLCRGEPAWPGPEVAAAERLGILLSHPEWLVRRWIERLGEERAERALQAGNRPAPTTLRVNRRRGARDELQRLLAAEGISTAPGRWSVDALRVERGWPAGTGAFRDGWFYIQDEASQLVAALAAPRPGERVADLCAAPGGKATDLAARLGGAGRLLAADRSLERLGLVRHNAARLGLGPIALLVQDAGAPALRDRSLDLVLVDAPCSGTGILRRQPEIRWRRREADVQRLAAEQRRMLAAAAAAVRPGGRLVYSVCSLEPEEGPQVVAAFLADRDDFALDDPRRAGVPAGLVETSAPGPHLRTRPERHDLDGFFAAALRRRGA